MAILGPPPKTEFRFCEHCGALFLTIATENPPECGPCLMRGRA